MMSDRTFSRRFSSYWKKAMPMADHFIRRVNMNPVRFADPVLSRALPERRGLINETAFLLAENAAEDGALDGNFDHFDFFDFFEGAEAEAVRRIALLEKRPAGELVPLDSSESTEVIDISKAILKFIKDEGASSDFTFSPGFPGCGLISECVGDLLVKDSLCELKAGERGFRSHDLRQVLICICLNHAQPKHRINRLCVVNPRRGVKFDVQVDVLSKAIAGASFVDVANDLIRFVSETHISR